MLRRKKHACTNFKDAWKITNGGILRCVCGEAQEQNGVTPIPNPSALTDDHPAGKADTSREAFEQHNRARGQMQVEHLIRASANGLTAEEAADAMGVGQATTSARFNDLKRAGMLEKTGRRNTRSGRSAGVWRMKAGM